MLKFGIRYIDYYLPADTIDVNEFVDQLRTETIPKSFSDREEYKTFATTVLELKRVRVENKLTGSEMLSALLETMFKKNELDPLAIDLIVMVSERPVSGDKNLAQFLQYKFGMNNAVTLNMSGNHCANLDVIVSIIATLGSVNIKNVLILNSTLVLDADQRVIGTYGILGDAAGIIVLSSDVSIFSIVDYYLMNSGRLHAADVEIDNTLLHSKNILKCIRALTHKTQIRVDDIKKVVLQNANPLLNARILSNAGIDPDKIYTYNFGRYGHLDCLDFVVNLTDLYRSPELRSGDLILTLGMGWAGAYASILFSRN
jgi:3-oxoacyl-[acyl-carrier-protein] synthase III